MSSVIEKKTRGTAGVQVLLRIEEAAFVVFSIYLFTRLPFAWWVYPLAFFAPDISLIAHFGGKRAGILVYNLLHHKALALGAYVAGSLLGLPVLSLTGVVLLGHSSLDRVLGFGLLEGKPEGLVTQLAAR